MLRDSCNAVVIAAACMASAGKLRHGAANVVATTQEINRCLSLVRVATRPRKLAVSLDTPALKNTRCAQASTASNTDESAQSAR
jgi:hypothetical protein